MTVQTLYLGRERVIPGLEFVTSGKVRDIYATADGNLLFVTSDRVSAFDVIMEEGVAYKGEVLTRIAAWWFAKTAQLVPNHLLSTRVEDVPGLNAEWRQRLRGRIMLVKRAAPTTVEWVVRGYVAGSGWKDYQKTQSICGLRLPAGLQLASRLPAPILTPTTKDNLKDLPLTHEQARERVGAAIFDQALKYSLALFARGTEVLARSGILLADTKFEFGLVAGQLTLIDEALTPDSSRFWPADQWRPGENPPSYDKQILRDWLETQDWNKQYPPPPVDPAVLEKTSRMYVAFCRKLTGDAPQGA